MPEIIDVLLSKANAQMLSVAKLVSARDANAVSEKLKQKLDAAPKTESKPAEVVAPPKEEKKKEVPKETDIAAGLGSLFG